MSNTRRVKHARAQYTYININTNININEKNYIIIIVRVRTREEYVSFSGFRKVLGRVLFLSFFFFRNGGGNGARRMNFSRTRGGRKGETTGAK